MDTVKLQSYLKKAEEGISAYLNDSRKSGKIDEQLYSIALKNTYANLKKWLEDPNIDRISPNLKSGIAKAIDEGRWTEIVNAYRQSVRFGTGGIRGMMAFDRDSIVRIQEEGIDAPVLKGPNTINNLVFLLTSAGVAKFGNEKGYKKIVIGYDSRVRGFDLAKIVAELFLAYGFRVYIFDAPCPYPEVTFAIPDDSVKAEIGILISASHNDYRYNGYKLSCANGSQFDPEERDLMFNGYIAKATTDDIKLLPFEKAEKDSLWFLGGDAPVPGFDYAGREKNLIDIHGRHRRHVQSFLMMTDIARIQKESSDPLKIGFCAYHGAGTIAVPRLLRESGFGEIYEISRKNLNKCDGLFPSFRSEAGLEQQPDPGDIRAAKIAVDAFKEDHPGMFDKIDILIGTDPDADRCGVIGKVPENQRFIFEDRDWNLLSADDLWALVIWYRLGMEVEKYGAVRDADKKFIVLSHTTSDCIVKLALKHGIGVVKTWVGFGSLAAATQKFWDGREAEYRGITEGRLSPDSALCDPIIHSCLGMDSGKRKINIGAMEQSNGFSLLGGPPADRSSLGENGHVRDKDGTFAAFLIAEIAAWAKHRGKTIFGLIDSEISLDPAIGLFHSGYEPDPLDGEYPGIEGDKLKKAILRRALGYFQHALAGDLEIGGKKIVNAVMYRTGKYDAIYPPTSDFVFPDEGIRFYFDDSGLNHVTVRPSGTGNSLRFHTQLNAAVSRENLIQSKYMLKFETEEIFQDLRKKLKAPRGKLFI